MKFVSSRFWSRSVVASLVVLASGNASAAEPGCEETIGNAEWLAGRWIGNGLGGEMEETWAPASGCQMLGHFRLSVNGKTVVYELMLIDVVDKALRMRVKHFTAEFVGWEAADSWHSFEPKQSERNHLTFDGLNIKRLDQSRIEIAVTLKREGRVVEEKLAFERAPL